MAEKALRSEAEGIAPGREPAFVPLRIISGTPDSDRIVGTGRADRIDALAGEDVVFGRGGADRIAGNGGADRLRGEGGADRITGGGGGDLLRGDGGADRLSGGGGGDRLRGGGGADRLSGGGGGDLLRGDKGDDLLLGGRGADSLKGGKDDDILDGGAGADRMTGGAGSDSFRFSGIDDGIDRITDYELGIDLLDLSSLLPEFEAGDPIADSVRFTIKGGDTVVAVSEDGGAGFVDLVRLLDVQIEALSTADLGLPTGPIGEPLLASTNAAGETADGLAFLPSVSGDGRFVTFSSEADNLVPGGGGGFNLYRKDLLTGEVVLVAPNRDKSAVSADGETVVHRSFGGGDIRVTDLDSGGSRVLGSVDEPSISADGSRAAFEDDAGGGRVARVVDTTTGDTIVSIPNVGEANPVRATLGTGRPDLSPDGGWLGFSREGQILLRSIADGDDIRVTAGGNGASTQPAVSSGGRFVTFQSGANNLVAEDDDLFIDVYRAEIDSSGAVVDIELVSAAPSGASGDGDSFTPAISDDGRFIAFRSAASNLAPGDDNGIPDIFVKDMASGLVQRLEMDGDSSGVIPQRLFQAAPDISGDGTFVAYTSDFVQVGEETVDGQVYVAAVGFDDGAAALSAAGPAPDLATLLTAPPDPAMA